MSVNSMPKENKMGTMPVKKLIFNMALPLIISMLIQALYNIVDQIFIGQGIGMLGNAATNIAFPLSTTCTAISLLLGIGSATNVSLKLGAGREKESASYAGCGILLMTISGIALFAITTLFLTPMLTFFGATKEVLPYAKQYTRITAIGFPFLIMNTGMSKLILADGSPRYSMISMLPPVSSVLSLSSSSFSANSRESPLKIAAEAISSVVSCTASSVTISGSSIAAADSFT